jgi:hypothetical protein
MARYGIPEAEISRAVGISEPTLRKHFRGELDTGLTKANAQVGEFIFSTIIGLPIPGRPPVTDERARATLAVFWAKTRMGWKETAVHQHEGKDGGPIEVSLAVERLIRRCDKLASQNAAGQDPAEPKAE